MSDEISPDSSKKKELETPLISKQNPSPSIFNTFVDRIKNIISPPTSEPQALAGRFHNLRESFAATINALGTRLEQAKEQGGDTFFYAQAILTPLQKEGERLMQQLSNTGVEQVRSITSYSRWLENVNLWLLKFETFDLDAMRQLYIQHSMKEAVGRVDKDLQLINEYLQQQLTILSLSEELKNKFQMKIEEELELYLFELHGLKVELPDIDIEGLENWKAELNKRRETYFNSSLSVIDRHVAGESTAFTQESELHHLTEIIQGIVELEEMLPHIEIILKQEGLAEVRETMLTQIKLLKDRAHILSVDLRLPVTFQERLEEVITTLEESEKLLNHEHP